MRRVFAWRYRLGSTRRGDSPLDAPLAQIDTNEERGERDERAKHEEPGRLKRDERIAPGLRIEAEAQQPARRGIRRCGIGLTQRISRECHAVERLCHESAGCDQ